MQHEFSDLITIANRIVHGDDDIPLSKVAISVFDRWLGRDDLHLLDCVDADERENRNRRLLSFWAAIYDTQTVISRSNLDVFAVPKNRDAYIEKCRRGATGGNDVFQCVVLPELGAIYYQNWDDTNVLFFCERSRIEPLLTLAHSCELSVIEFEV